MEVLNKNEQEIANIIEILSKNNSAKESELNERTEKESILLDIYLKRHEESTNRLL